MRTVLIATTTAALAAGAALLAAAPAQARPLEQPYIPALVWSQSFARASVDAPCVPPASLDIPWQDDWNPAEKAWIPTWEQWPNGGTGGWTCFRQITWAKGSSPVVVD